MKEKIADIWIRIELILVLISTSIILLSTLGTKTGSQYIIIIFIVFFIVLMAVIFNFIRHRGRKLMVVSRWLDIVTIPLILSGIWAIVVTFAMENKNTQWLVAIVSYVILFVMFLPIVKVDFGRVTNTIGRIIMTVILMESFLTTESVSFKSSSNFWFTVFNTGTISASICFILGMLIAREWGFDLNPNLEWLKSPNFSYLSLGILFVVQAWYIFWNAYGIDSNNLLTTIFGIELHKFTFSWPALLRPIETGILEETFRYLLIISLIVGLKKSKFRLQLTVVISSLIFGAMHIGNVGEQKLNATIGQICFAAASGLILGIIYLYTGKLWLSMITHFALDFLAFSQPGGLDPIVWNGSVGDWLNLSVSIIIPVVLVTWMMTGRRKLVMEENIERLLARRN